MFDLKEIDKNDNRADRINKLFDKPSVEPRPSMERERIYSGMINPLSNDVMIYRDNKLLIARWNTINGKTEFDKGISFYFPEDKIKISALYYKNNCFVKYYCEVVEVDYKKDIDKYVFRDLIVDVDVFADGNYVIRDEDELETALKKGLISPEKAHEILKVKDKILYLIKADEIPPKWCISKVEKGL